MGDLRDIPVIGRVVAWGLLTVDLLLSGGDMVVSLLLAVLETVIGSPALAFGLLSGFNRVGKHLAFLPAGLSDVLQQVLVIGAIVVFLYRIAQFKQHVTEKTK